MLRLTGIQLTADVPALHVCSSNAHLRGGMLRCVTADCAAEPDNCQMVQGQQPDLQQRIQAVSRAAAPVDGVLNLAGISSEMLQQQLMFEVSAAIRT